MAEAGYPELTSGSWQGIFVPAGTPKEVVDKLYAAMIETMKTPEVVQRLANGGVDVVTSKPGEFAKFVQSETDRWGKAVQEAGATRGLGVESARWTARRSGGRPRLVGPHHRAAAEGQREAPSGEGRRPGAGGRRVRALAGHRARDLLRSGARRSGGAGRGAVHAAHAARRPDRRRGQREEARVLREAAVAQPRRRAARGEGLQPERGGAGRRAREALRAADPGAGAPGESRASSARCCRSRPISARTSFSPLPPTTGACRRRRRRPGR